ncbi:MAG: conjugal transfer protein TraD [Alphaproteobacteria bacterium]|nr:conjugal transfer protein TraD [Alphaproteobacteria bacterium]MDE2110512.1 conjugal transfer protein TraD [Alphaproteobacteria bacterium]MDE2493262.1 conjugal transfer protein TraD [Alphaproteobacteria bacterium]
MHSTWKSWPVGSWRWSSLTKLRGRLGVSGALRSFAGRHASLRKEIATTQKALRRATAARHRLEAQQARYDTREWVVKRRERTRHLIELGGLVVKSGLVELANDDRALLYGAFLQLAYQLQNETREQTATLWRRSGSRAFKAEKEAAEQKVR